MSLSPELTDLPPRDPNLSANSLVFEENKQEPKLPRNLSARQHPCGTFHNENVALAPTWHPPPRVSTTRHTHTQLSANQARWQETVETQPTSSPAVLHLALILNPHVHGSSAKPSPNCAFFRC